MPTMSLGTPCLQEMQQHDSAKPTIQQRLLALANDLCDFEQVQVDLVSKLRAENDQLRSQLEAAGLQTQKDSKMNSVSSVPRERQPLTEDDGRSSRDTDAGYLRPPSDPKSPAPSWAQPSLAVPTNDDRAAGVGEECAANRTATDNDDWMGRRATEAFPVWFHPSTKATKRSGRATTVLAGAEEAEKDASDCGVLQPVGRLRLSWDFLWCISFVFDLWVTTFTMVFLPTGSTSSLLILLGKIVVVFFVLDILINFNTGYFDGQVVVMRRRLIAKHYLRFWLWFDIFATIPIDDILASAEGSAFSVLRAAKVPKAARFFKVLKLLRLVKVYIFISKKKWMQKASAVERLHKSKANESWSSSVWKAMDKPLQWLATIAQVFVATMVWAHTHGCIWAALQPAWEFSEDNEEALGKYWDSFSWAYLALMAGRLGITPADINIQLLELVVSFQRLLFAGVVCALGAQKFQSIFRDDAAALAKTDSALQYLSSHDVSIKTQTQVLHCMQQAGGTLQKLQNFNRLLQSKDLPEELSRRVREELWSHRLMSLGLILHIGRWDEGFVAELAQQVYEEVYASKVIVCNEGDMAIAAYQVLSGELLVTSSAAEDDIPPFTQGMWLGERALLSTSLRRSGAVCTVSLSRLMVVPTASFQDLLQQFGLKDKFNDFCTQELWKGLCGRCGVLADHFADECPTLDCSSSATARCSSGSDGSQLLALDSCSHYSRELRMFLRQSSLGRLTAVLKDLGVESLSDLEQVDISDLVHEMTYHENLEFLTDDEIAALSPANIKAFRKNMGRQALSIVGGDRLDLQHYLFLSHYKLEAGTEAALMRAELETMLHEEGPSIVRSMEAPVFLDSEDLDNLEDLQTRVRNSHNLVLLLTKDVLKRPWVLVEIATAVETGVRIVPVQVFKLGTEFEYPTEATYEDMLTGKYLDCAARDLLEEAGFQMQTVVDAVRQVFKRIAVPYSPHRRATIRKAELDAVLHLCRRRELQAEVDAGHTVSMLLMDIGDEAETPPADGSPRRTSNYGGALPESFMTLSS